MERCCYLNRKCCACILGIELRVVLTSFGDQTSHVHVLSLKLHSFHLSAVLSLAGYGLMVCDDHHRTAWSTLLFFGKWEPCQVFPFQEVLPNLFRHSISLAILTGTSSCCCAWGSHRHHYPEVHSAPKKRKRSTQLLDHLSQTAEHPMTLDFQKAPSDPPRSLSPAPELGFGTSQSLRVNVYVCLVAREKSKGRPKVPLQPQQGAEIHFQDES